jgi:hypothetical protein
VGPASGRWLYCQGNVGPASGRWLYCNTLQLNRHENLKFAVVKVVK